MATLCVDGDLELCPLPGCCIVLGIGLAKVGSCIDEHMFRVEELAILAIIFLVIHRRGSGGASGGYWWAQVMVMQVVVRTGAESTFFLSQQGSLVDGVRVKLVVVVPLVGVLANGGGVVERRVADARRSDNRWVLLFN